MPYVSADTLTVLLQSLSLLIPPKFRSGLSKMESFINNEGDGAELYFKIRYSDISRNYYNMKHFEQC